MENVDHLVARSIAGRRKFLRIAASGVAAVPLGAMAPASWRTDRSSLPRYAGPCPHLPRGSGGIDAVAPGATPREIRMIWNSNAICHRRGVPVADQPASSQAKSQGGEDQSVGRDSQLLEAMASGKADAGPGMALGG